MENPEEDLLPEPEELEPEDIAQPEEMIISPPAPPEDDVPLAQEVTPVPEEDLLDIDAFAVDELLDIDSFAVGAEKVEFSQSFGEVAGQQLEYAGPRPSLHGFDAEAMATSWVDAIAPVETGLSKRTRNFIKDSLWPIDVAAFEDPEVDTTYHIPLKYQNKFYDQAVVMAKEVVGDYDDMQEAATSGQGPPPTGQEDARYADAKELLNRGGWAMTDFGFWEQSPKKYLEMSQAVAEADIKSSTTDVPSLSGVSMLLFQAGTGISTGDLALDEGALLKAHGEEGDWYDDAEFQMRLEDGTYLRDESGQVYRSDELGDIEYYNPESPSLLEADGTRGDAWRAYQMRWGRSPDAGWKSAILNSRNIIPRMDRAHAQAADKHRTALGRLDSWMQNLKGVETRNIPTVDPDGGEIPAFQIALGSIDPSNTKYALKLKAEAYHWQNVQEGLASAKKSVLRFSQTPEARNGIMSLEHHGRSVDEIMTEIAESVLSAAYETPERKTVAGLRKAAEIEASEAREKELGFWGHFTEEDGGGLEQLAANGQRNLVETFGVFPMAATFVYDSGAAFIDPDRSGFARLGEGFVHLGEGAMYMFREIRDNPGAFAYRNPVDVISFSAAIPATAKMLSTRVALSIQKKIAANRAAVSAIDDVLAGNKNFVETAAFLETLGPEESALAKTIGTIVDDQTAAVKRASLLDDVAALEESMGKWTGHIKMLEAVARNMDLIELSLRLGMKTGGWAFGPTWRRMFAVRDDILDIGIQGKTPDGTLFETTIGEVVRSKNQRLHVEIRELIKSGKKIPSELLDEIEAIMRDLPGHKGGELWISTPDGFIDRLEPLSPDGPGSVLGEPAFGGAAGLEAAVLKRMSKKARATQARRARRLREIIRIEDPAKIRRELEGLRLSPEETSYLNDVVDKIDVLRTLADPTTAAMSRVTRTEKARLADAEISVRATSDILRNSYETMFLEHTPDVDRVFPVGEFEKGVMGRFDEIVRESMEDIDTLDAQLPRVNEVNRRLAESLQEQLADWNLQIDESGRLVDQASSPHRDVVVAFNRAADDIAYAVSQQDRALSNLRKIEQRLATKKPTSVSADAARATIRALERKEETVAILQQRLTDINAGDGGWEGGFSGLDLELNDLRDKGAITPKQHKAMMKTVGEVQQSLKKKAPIPLRLKTRLRDDLDQLVTELDNEGAFLAADAELQSPALDKEHPRFRNTVNKLTGDRRKLLKERQNAIDKGRKIRPGQYVSGDEGVLSELLNRLEANTLRGIINDVGPVDFGAGQIRIGPKGKRWVDHDSLEARPLLDDEELFKSPSGVLYREARPDEIGSRIRRTEKDTIHEISEVASDYVAAGFRTKDPVYRPRNVRERIRDNPEKGEDIMDYILENKYGGGSESPWDLGRFGEAIEPKLMPDGSPHTLQKWFEDTFPEENKKFYRDMGDIQGVWDDYADVAPSVLPLGAFDGVSGAEFRMMIMATDDVVLLESLWDAFMHHNREYSLEKGKAGTLPVEAVRQQIDSLYGRRPVVSFACPTCVAKSGGPCVRPGGQKLSRYHAARKKKADVLDPNQTASTELRAERIMDVLLPDDPMTVSGRFELKRDYVIREGDMVRVVGAVDQPRLNTEASRQVRDKVGAHLIEMSEHGWPAGYLSPSERRYYRDLIEKHAEGVADVTIGRRVLDVDEKLADNHRKMEIAQTNRKARLLHRDDPAAVVNLELEKMNQAIESAWLDDAQRAHLHGLARELSHLRHEASAASRGAKLEAAYEGPETRRRKIDELQEQLEAEKVISPDRAKVEILRSKMEFARGAKNLEEFNQLKKEFDAEKAKRPDKKKLARLKKDVARLSGRKLTRKQKKILTKADEVAVEISAGLRSAGMKVDDLHVRIDAMHAQLEHSLTAAEHRFREFHVNSATPHQASKARQIMEESMRTGGAGPTRTVMAAIIRAGELPRAIPGKHIAAARAWQLMQKLDTTKPNIKLREKLEIEHNLRPEQMTGAIEEYFNLLNTKFDAEHLSEAVGVYINRPHNALEDFNISQLSESSRISSDLRTKVMNLGAKAVKEGLLNEITFGMHIAEYFPDLYRQYEAHFKAFSDKGGLSVIEEVQRYREIKGNHFRHAEYKEQSYKFRKEIGLIDDPRYTSLAGFSRIAHDVELARLFRELDEAVFAPEHAKHSGKKIVQEPVRKPDKKGRPDVILSSERPAHVPEGWKQLPGDARKAEGWANGTRGFGRIGGKWVPTELFDELVELQRMPGVAWDLWRTVVRFWKIGMTALNPASHLRNFVSCVVIADFNGMLSDGTVRSIWGDTWREAWALEGKWADEAIEAGLLGTDQISIEVNRELGRYVGMPEAPAFSSNGFELSVKSTDAVVRHPGWDKLKRGAGAAKRAVGDVAEGAYEMTRAKKATEWAKRAYIFEDNFFKLLRYKQLRMLQAEFAQTGTLTKQMIRAVDNDFNAALALMDMADPDAAMRAVSKQTFKHFFDYSNTSRAINWARNYYQPFIVWNSKAIPMMGDMMTRYPIKAAAYRTAFREMENLSYHMDGELSEEDIMTVEEQKSQLSAYSRLGSVYKGRRVWEDARGNEHNAWQFGDLQYWTPAGNITRPSDEFTLGYVPDLILPNDPILTMIATIGFNKRPGDWGNDLGNLVEWGEGAELLKDALPAYWDAFRHTMLPPLLGGRGYDKLEAAGAPFPPIGHRQTWSMDPHPYYANVEGKPMSGIEAVKDVFFGFRTSKMYEDAKFYKMAKGQIQGAKSTGTVRDLMMDPDSVIGTRVRRTNNAVGHLNMAEERMRRNQARRLEMMGKKQWRDDASAYRELRKKRDK
jgi:hypothetical protein